MQLPQFLQENFGWEGIFACGMLLIFLIYFLYIYRVRKIQSKFNQAKNAFEEYLDREESELTLIQDFILNYKPIPIRKYGEEKRYPEYFRVMWNEQISFANKKWRDLLVQKEGIQLEAAGIFPPYLKCVKKIKQYHRDLETFYFKSKWLSEHLKALKEVEGFDENKLRGLVLQIEKSKRNSLSRRVLNY